MWSKIQNSQLVQKLKSYRSDSKLKFYIISCWLMIMYVYWTPQYKIQTIIIFVLEHSELLITWLAQHGHLHVNLFKAVSTRVENWLSSILPKNYINHKDTMQLSVQLYHIHKMITLTNLQKYQVITHSLSLHYSGLLQLVY